MAQLTKAEMAIHIGDVTIRQDADGRYCLNDLHRASGGEKRHGPSYWLDAQQIQELVQELSDTGIPVSVIRGGLQQGTYVCKELVYAYAMWISPKFHLRVIRTFDSVSTGQQSGVPALPDFADPAAAAEAWAQEFRAKRQVMLALEAAKPAIQHHEAVKAAINDISFMQMARTLTQAGHTIGRNNLIALLRDAGVLVRAEGKDRNTPTQAMMERGYFRVAESTSEDSGGLQRIHKTTYVTGKGECWILENYPKLKQRAEQFRKSRTCALSALAEAAA